ncbi:aminomethyltransferase family protein [Aestuariivirga sp.]|uniref:aminomethyltransferase family protein n=1 Tax=Aestuariivirga sp. TaxID=2650926 RepID=UPI00301A7553
MSNSIHSDRMRTVQVSARRFERSPFEGKWLGPDTVMGVYAGRYYSVFNGEDVENGYWTLRRKAVLYDVPERPVEISGPDAERFLEHTFSRRITTLKEGRGRYAIACDHRGHVFMDGVLFRLGHNRFWYVQPDGALETWLLANSAGFDITVTDPLSRVLQIQGPASLAIMSAATDGAITEDMGYFHAGFFTIAGQRVYVSRTGWTGEMGYEVYTQGAATDCDRLWDRLMAVGQPHGMIFGSISSMEMRRIEAGILDNGTDFDLTMTPFEAGLGRFVDLDKSDFIGRAALLTADQQGKRLFGLKCRSGIPGYREVIMEGTRPVGHVTAGTWSPFLALGIGYVRFDVPGPWAGRELQVRTAEKGVLDCEIIDLPFYDPEKRIPRGLDRSAV